MVKKKILLSIDEDLLEKIDICMGKIGYGATRTAFFERAARKHLRELEFTKKWGSI